MERPPFVQQELRGRPRDHQRIPPRPPSRAPRLTDPHHPGRSRRLSPRSRRSTRRTSGRRAAATRRCQRRRRSGGAHGEDPTGRGDVFGSRRADPGRGGDAPGDGGALFGDQDSGRAMTAFNCLTQMLLTHYSLLEIQVPTKAFYVQGIFFLSIQHKWVHF